MSTTGQSEALIAKPAPRKPGAGGSAVSEKPLSHNLNGQKLGRKGRDTRDRILAATAELIAEFK